MGNSGRPTDRTDWTDQTDRGRGIGRRVAAGMAVILLAAAMPLFAAEVPFAEADAPEMMKAAALSGNLLPNGSFEAGRHWPFRWEPTDKLGTIWAEGGTDGKRCLRMDTDILDTQWAEWNARALRFAAEAAARGNGDAQTLPADPIPDPPKKLPTKAPYYDTVGGIHGVHYRSDFIKCAPGAIYRFTVDARSPSPGEPKVFIKGFYDETMKTEKGPLVIKRDAGNAMLTLVKCNAEWQRWVCVFHPARWKSTLNYKPLRVEWLRVDLYSYWPQGVYEFDNARLEIVGYEQAAPAPAPDAAPAEPKSQPVEPTDEDAFPVIK